MTSPKTKPTAVTLTPTRSSNPAAHQSSPHLTTFVSGRKNTISINAHAPRSLAPRPLSVICWLFLHLNSDVVFPKK